MLSVIHNQWQAWGLRRRIVVCGLLVITGGLFVVISVIAPRNVELAGKVVTLTGINKDLRGQIKILTRKVVDLEEEILTLQDSITFLEKRITARDSTLELLDVEKRKLKIEMRQLNAQNVKIRKQLSVVIREKNIARDSILKLVNLRDSLENAWSNADRRIKSNDDERRKREDERKALRDTIDERNFALAEREREIKANKIAAHTTVTCRKIDFLTSTGKSVVKGKKVPNKWDKIPFVLHLSHPKSILKPGMQFMVKLIDATDGNSSPLPFNEGTGRYHVLVSLTDEFTLESVFSNYDRNKEGKRPYLFEIYYVPNPDNLQGVIKLADEKWLTDGRNKVSFNL